MAPSSPFDRTLVLRGMGFLQERYRVRFAPSLFAREGFLAGSDARRLEELDRALGSDAAAVVAARGGYGLTRLLPRLDLSKLRESPKWLVGFSDFTALHLAAGRIGVASLHAHNVAGLGRGDAVSRDAFVAALEAPEHPRSLAGFDSWTSGVCRGRLAGGNLTLLFTSAAEGQLRLPDDCILILEDVSESSYRIDRMLTALVNGGHLDRVAGVVLGEFFDCPSGRYGVSGLDVAAERLTCLGVPVISQACFGHGRWNTPLPLGLVAELDATSGVLRICPSH